MSKHFSAFSSDYCKFAKLYTGQLYKGTRNTRPEKTNTVPGTRPGKGPENLANSIFTEPNFPNKAHEFKS